MDLKAREMRLPKTRAVPRTVLLSSLLVQVLAELPRIVGNPWGIPGQKPCSHMADLNQPWRIVRKCAGILEVRLHGCHLHHSFDSRALVLVESLPTITKLLGHGLIQNKEIYAHLAKVPSKPRCHGWRQASQSIFSE